MGAEKAAEVKEARGEMVEKMVGERGEGGEGEIMRSDINSCRIPNYGPSSTGLKSAPKWGDCIDAASLAGKTKPTYWFFNVRCPGAY